MQPIFTFFVIVLMALLLAYIVSVGIQMPFIGGDFMRQPYAIKETSLPCPSLRETLHKMFPKRNIVHPKKILLTVPHTSKNGKPFDSIADEMCTLLNNVFVDATVLKSDQSRAIIDDNRLSSFCLNTPFWKSFRNIECDWVFDVHSFNYPNHLKLEGDIICMIHPNAHYLVHKFTNALQEIDTELQVRQYDVQKHNSDTLGISTICSILQIPCVLIEFNENLRDKKKAAQIIFNAFEIMHKKL